MRSFLWGRFYSPHASPQTWPKILQSTGGQHRSATAHPSHLHIMLRKQALCQFDLSKPPIPPALKKKVPAFPEGKAGTKYPQQWMPETSEKETAWLESCDWWDTYCGLQAHYHRQTQSSTTDLMLAPFGEPGRGGFVA